MTEYKIISMIAHAHLFSFRFYHYFCSVLAFVFAFSFYFFYINSVLKGKAKPTFSSWLSWGIIDGVILAAMIKKEAVAWQMYAYLSGTLTVVFLSSYKKSLVMDWERKDTISICVVLFSLVLWFITSTPEVAVLISLGASLAGAVPMVINMAKNPKREPILPWIICATGGFFGICAATPITGTPFTITGSLTPVVYGTFQMTVVLMTLRGILISRKQEKST